MKYRKKPIVIEAIHWTGNREVVDEFMGVTKHPDDANHAYYRTNVMAGSWEKHLNNSDWKTIILLTPFRGKNARAIH